MKTFLKLLAVTGSTGLLMLTPAHAYAQEHAPVPTTSQDIVLDIKETPLMQFAYYIKEAFLFVLYLVLSSAPMFAIIALLLYIAEKG